MRFRHYTKPDTMREIMRLQRINLGDRGRVHAVSANAKVLSPHDAEEAYGIDPGRGKACVEFDGEADEAEWYKNPLTQATEARFRHAIDLTHRNATGHLNR